MRTVARRGRRCQIPETLQGRGSLEKRYRDDAEKIPLEERDAQQQYDFTYRDFTNRSDPMNVLAERAFGKEKAKFMLDRRGGHVQMDADRGKWKT